MITYRNFKSIELLKFSDDLHKIEIAQQCDNDDPDIAVGSFNSIVLETQTCSCEDQGYLYQALVQQ